MILMSYLKKFLATTQVMVVFVPNMEYKDALVQISDLLNKNYNKILYVTLNRSCSALISTFDQNKMDYSKFHFIDCVTKNESSSIENCTHVPSPNALIELSLAISDVMESQKPEVMLFDSPSTLLIYNKEDHVTKFVHSLISKLTMWDSKGIFTVPEESADILMVKDIEMFVDKTISLKVS